jgi:hypothetical protein
MCRFWPVTCDLYPYVSGGDLKVSVSNVSVSTTNFDFDWDSFLWDVIDYFGVPVDDWIADYMEDALTNELEDELPTMLADTLDDLQLDYAFKVQGNTYDLVASPYSVAVDSTGVTLKLSTAMTAASWKHSETGLGSLYYSYSSPTWSTTSGMNVGMSADFINQALYAFWGGGLLDVTLTNEQLGLDLGDVSTFLPYLSDLTVVTTPLLPPVVEPGTGSEVYDLEMGDFHVTLYDGAVASGSEFLDVYVSVIAGLDVDISADNTLSAEIVDPELYFDVVYPEANTVAAADTEALLEALIPMLLPRLTDGLSEVALPEFEEFGWSNLQMGKGGAEKGFMTVGGSLKPL